METNEKILQHQEYLRKLLNRCSWDEKHRLVLTRLGLRYYSYKLIPFESKLKIERFFYFYNCNKMNLKAMGFSICKERDGWLLKWYDPSAESLKPTPDQMRQLEAELHEYLDSLIK